MESIGISVRAVFYFLSPCSTAEAQLCRCAIMASTLLSVDFDFGSKSGAKYYTQGVMDPHGDMLFVAAGLMKVDKPQSNSAYDNIIRMILIRPHL